MSNCRLIAFLLFVSFVFCCYIFLLLLSNRPVGFFVIQKHFIHIVFFIFHHSLSCFPLDFSLTSKLTWLGFGMKCFPFYFPPHGILGFRSSDFSGLCGCNPIQKIGFSFFYFSEEKNPSTYSTSTCYSDQEGLTITTTKECSFPSHG